jgi:putative methionine-R-sulfoxide reductase with GAF domain
MLGALDHSFLDQIEKSLDKSAAADSSLEDGLIRILNHFGCTIGTIHCFDSQSNQLQLRAQCGISTELMPRIRVIPIGKGMAGLAAQRRQPVQVCNLQADTSGLAQPAAKMTQMEGSVAVPILVEDSLRGVLGVAKPTVYEFSAAEIALLLHVGRVVGRFLGPKPDVVPEKEGG